MLRIIVDENLWFIFEIDRLIYLDLHLVGLGLVLIATALLLRVRKLYKDKNLRKS